MIEKIQKDEVFTCVFRRTQNTYYAGQLLSLRINKKGLITTLMFQEMSLETLKLVS